MVNIRNKDRRATSFIISGFPTSTNCPDQKIVTDLCLNEFNMQMDIANTKRLGNTPSSATPSSEIQVFLITFLFQIVFNMIRMFYLKYSWH